MVDKAALQAWANGKSSKGIVADADEASEMAEFEDENLEGEDEDDLEEGEEGEGEEGERELLWAGEEEGDLAEIITPERAEAFLAWLAENEPVVHEVLVELAEAYVAGDQTMIDHGKEELGWVEQVLNDEYPELTEEQREMASENIGAMITEFGGPPKDSPEWKQAVAIGMAKARRGEAV